MALAKSAVIFFIMMSTLYSVSVSAHELKVVDSSGLIINIGNATRHVKIPVGKTCVFTYDKNKHNVLQVTQTDLESCNTTSPIKKFTSGYDLITFDKVGHFYYMCGFPDHCESGEKYDIEVIQNSGQSSTSARSYSLPVISRRKIGSKDTHLYSSP